MGFVSKFMKPIHIGKVTPVTRPGDDEMKKDFIELRKTAEKMVIFHTSSKCHILMLLLLLLITIILVMLGIC